MARTPLAVVDVGDAYDTTGTLMAYVAADNVNGNSVPLTGRELLLVRNDNVGPQTITIDSTPDPFTRDGDITADPIAIGAYRVFQLFPTKGWKQASGDLHIDASAADVMLCVLRLPKDVR